MKLSSPFIELLTQFLILDSTSEMHTKKVLSMAEISPTVK